MTEGAAVDNEVRLERVWRERCGEPKPNDFPVRCRRDLSHPTPHAGLGSAVTVWPGAGNTLSAQVGGNGAYRCWHTLREEGAHWKTWRDVVGETA